MLEEDWHLTVSRILALKDKSNIAPQICVAGSSGPVRNRDAGWTDIRSRYGNSHWE